ncbi:MAG: hypothetical protein AAGG01_06780, partial [Planctomycetota bacterium]
SAVVEVMDWNSRPVMGAVLNVAPLYGLMLPEAKALPLELIRGSMTELDLRTDAGGRVRYVEEMDSLPSSSTIDAKDSERLFTATHPGHVTAIAGTWRPSLTDSLPFVILAPARRLEVRVHGFAGHPLDELRAWITLDEGVAARFDRSFVHAYPQHWIGRCDGATVTFDAVPNVKGANLTIEAPGHGCETWPLRDVRSNLTLGARSQGAVLVRGVIVDAEGSPTFGAVVTQSGQRGEVDTEGRFAVRVDPPDEFLWIVAAHRAPRRLSLDLDRSEDLVELGRVQLGEPSAALEGWVVDEAGMPLGGITVWPESPTKVASASTFTVLESIGAGGDGATFYTRTDDRGHFRLEGLDGSRAYTLRLLDESTAQWDRLAPARPGEQLHVRFAEGRGFRAVKARLVDDEGLPVPNVSVRVRGAGHAQGASNVFAHGVEAKTDADGFFELVGVPAQEVKIVPRDARLVAAERPVESFQGVEEWRVPRVAQLQVVLHDIERADSFEIQRSDESLVALRRPTGLGYSNETRIELQGGRSPVLGLGCDARTLVLLRDGEVVDRVAIRPLAGEVLRLGL